MNNKSGSEREQLLVLNTPPNKRLAAALPNVVFHPYDVAGGVVSGTSQVK